MGHQNDEQSKHTGHNRLGIGVAVGIVFGAGIGTAVNNIAIGVAMGIVFGAVLGVALDAAAEQQTKDKGE